MAKNANAPEAVNVLIEVANADTVYRDLYLSRARELFSATLDEPAYRAIASIDKEIEDLMHRSRSAALQRNWNQAAELSTQVEAVHQRKAAMANMAAIGKALYDSDTVAFDSFSPGKHLGAQSDAKQPMLCKQLLDNFALLAKLDPNFGASYEKRRAYFSSL